MNTEFNQKLLYTMAAALAWTLLLMAACLSGRAGRKGKWLAILFLSATTAAGYLLGMLTYPSPSGYVAFAHHSRTGGIFGAVSGFLFGMVIVGVFGRFARIVWASKNKNSNDGGDGPSEKPHSRLKELGRLALICFVGWETVLMINAATFLFLANDFKSKNSIQSNNTTIDFHFDPLVHIHRSHSILSSLPTRWILFPLQAEFVVETRKTIEDYHQYREKNEGIRQWTPTELKTSPPVRMPGWVLRRIDSDDDVTYLIPLIFSPILPAEYEDRAAQCLKRTIVSRHVLPH